MDIIYCACGCGEQLEKFNKWGKKRKFIYGHHTRGTNNPFFGKKHSKETLQKQSLIKIGKPSSLLGRHLSEEYKKKLSLVKIDKPSIFKGKHHSEESKRKMSLARSGNKCYKYIDGCSKQRHQSKRRRNLGYITLNERFKGSHGHHLDKDHVLFIPKELHRSMYHSVLGDINMEIINKIAMDWYSGREE